MTENPAMTGNLIMVCNHDNGFVWPETWKWWKTDNGDKPDNDKNLDNGGTQRNGENLIMAVT